MSPEGKRPGSKDSKAVYQISEARPGLSEDVSARTRRYVISMGIRTVCFLIAVFTEGWVRWTFVAAAVLLPYIAVIMANAGRERVEALPATAPLNSQPALPPGTGPVVAPENVGGVVRATGVAPSPPDDPTDLGRRAS